MYSCKSKKIQAQHHAHGQQPSSQHFHKVSDVVTDHKHHSPQGTAKAKSTSAKHKKKQTAELRYRNQKNDGVFYMY